MPAECCFLAKNKLPHIQLTTCSSAPECRHEKILAAHPPSDDVPRFERYYRLVNRLRGHVWYTRCADRHVCCIPHDDYGRCERHLNMDLRQLFIGHDQ